MLHRAEEGRAGEAMRFWESSAPFIVLGRIGKAREDLKTEEVRKDHVAVLRRSSGGGTVVQGQGCFNYSFVLSKEQNPLVADLRKSYQFILNKVIDCLNRLGVQSKFCPVSDIAMMENNKKISGNAQKRSKTYILHHGTILYDFDLKQIERYLNMPKDVPQYRNGRGHLEFVANAPVDISSMKSLLKASFKADREERHLNDDEQECLHQFLKTKNINVDLEGA